MLSVALARRLGSFELDVAFEIERRGPLVIVGESGSGKTTLLRLLAGLLEPDRGRIEVDTEVWFDGAVPSSLPPHRRPVGYVAQDYALFPHLSVFDNVAFGLKRLSVSRAEIGRRTHLALAQLGVAELARRMPHALSGGQAQRVALARAIVLAPRLLLLDEPLSALDQRARRNVRSELRALLERLPCRTVFVTHNPHDALVFGETILALENGRIEQIGTRDDLTLKPRSTYVAEFLGQNLVRGRLEAGAPGTPARVLVDGAAVLVASIPEGDEPEGGTRPGEVCALVDPRGITLSRVEPEGSAQNVFRGEVIEVVPEPPDGERVRVALATSPPLVAEVTRAAVERMGIRPGAVVFASFKSTGVALYR